MLYGLLEFCAQNYIIKCYCTASSFCVQNSNKCCCTASLECVQLYWLLLYENLPQFLCQQSATGCTTCLEKRAAKTATSPSKSVPRKWYGCLGKHATSCCTDSALEIVPNLPWTVCKLCCTVLLKYCLGMCAKLLPPPPHCSEISLALLLSFSQSAHEIMNDLFLLFLL